MPPLSVMVKPVSGLCNMGCTYCFYADELTRRGSGSFAPMSDATMEALIRRAMMYADDTVSFAFQGGEPTLAGADFYRRFLALERQYNTRRLPVHHALQTNGLALEEDMLAVLGEGRFLVGVSMDGTQAIHDSRRVDRAGGGTFDRVSRTLSRLRQAGVDYNVLCVVDRQIASQPKAVVQALRPHGYLQFIPCMDPLDGTLGADSLTAADYGAFLCRTFDEYERAFRSGHYFSIRTFDNWLEMLMGHPPEACNLCGRCSRNYLIESNGNVYPCDFYALDEWMLGNINDCSFARLARSPLQQRFLDESAWVDPACQECRWYSLCRGGCRREREPFIAGQPRLFRLCEGHKLFFEACYDRLAALTKVTAPKPPKAGK